MFLVLLREDPLFYFRKRVEWTKLQLVRVFERGELLVLISLKVALGQVSTILTLRWVLRRKFPAKILPWGLHGIPEDQF